MIWIARLIFIMVFWAWKLLSVKHLLEVHSLCFLRFPETNCDLELCSFPDSGNIEVPEDLVHLAFQVEDLEWCMTKLEEEGVPITEGPIEAENGTRFIFTEDPDKYEIELVQYPKK